MSEIPTPYNPKGNKKSDLKRIAHFMNGYLGSELLMDISFPENLQGDYRDFSVSVKKEWHEFTFQQIFKESAYQIVGFLKRQLRPIELNLIKRRIAVYLTDLGVEYEKD
jgi:hypothetical protein